MAKNNKKRSKFKSSLHIMHNGTSRITDNQNGQYFCNARGAKIFHDKNKNKYLDIQLVENNISDDVKTYRVLSMGIMHIFDNEPCVTIEENGKAIFYLLPKQLSHRVEEFVNLARIVKDQFPTNIKFFRFANGTFDARIIK